MSHTLTQEENNCQHTQPPLDPTQEPQDRIDGKDNQEDNPNTPHEPEDATRTSKSLPPKIKTQSSTEPDLKLEAGLRLLQSSRNQFSKFDRFKQWPRRQPRNTRFGGPRPRRLPEIKKIDKAPGTNLDGYPTTSFRISSIYNGSRTHYTTQRKTIQRLNKRVQKEPMDH